MRQHAVETSWFSGQRTHRSNPRDPTWASEKPYIVINFSTEEAF